MDEDLDKKLQDFYKQINEILPTRIDFDQFSVEVDQGGATIYKSDEFYKISKNRIFPEINRLYSPKIIIDVGANIGFMTVLFSKFFPKTNIISIEPNYKLIEIIHSNCVLNNITNVEIIQKIIGKNTDITVPFQINDIMSVDSRVHGLKSNYHLVNVEETSIDKIIKKKNIPTKTPIFIKIDTQGFEERVIDGMYNLLNSFENYIVIMEFAPYWLEEAGTEPAKFLQKLCREYSVCEMPRETSFFQETLESVQKKKLRADMAIEFSDYTRELSRDSKGWCDLIIFKKTVS